VPSEFAQYQTDQCDVPAVGAGCTRVCVVGAFKHGVCVCVCGSSSLRDRLVTMASHALRLGRLSCTTYAHPVLIAHKSEPAVQS
jgi:hypothetical protein